MDNAPRSAPIISFGDVKVAQHQVTTQDNHPLAIYRLISDEQPAGRPVIFVHGAYSNKHFWLSPKGKGIARFFAEHHLDVWLMETRGHGNSVQNSRYKTISADDAIRFDFTAVSDYISTLNPNKQLWIGHSYGGLFLSFALGCGFLPQAPVAAFCIIGTQVKMGQEYLGFKPLAGTLKLATRLLGKFPARLAGLGGEDEPPAISNQFIDWKAAGTCRSGEGMDYINSLKNISIPCLALAGGNDTIDPPEGCKDFWENIGSPEKTFWLLSGSQGWSADYGHVDMIIGEPAAREVWPQLLEWATALSTPTPTTGTEALQT